MPTENCKLCTLINYKNLEKTPKISTGMIKAHLRLMLTITGYFLYWSKITIHLSLGFPKGRPRHRKDLQPSKENIQHFKTWHSLLFSIFVGLLPSWIRIRIQRLKLIRIHNPAFDYNSLGAVLMLPVSDTVDLLHQNMWYPPTLASGARQLVVQEALETTFMSGL